VCALLPDAGKVPGLGWMGDTFPARRLRRLGHYSRAPPTHGEPDGAKAN
jgi:hypothetical protein